MKKFLLLTLSLFCLNACEDIPISSSTDESGAITSGSITDGNHTEVVVGGNEEDSSHNSFDSGETSPAPATDLGQQNNALVSWDTLINQTESLSSQQIAFKLNHLDATEAQLLGVYEAFAGMLHLMACRSDQNTLMQTTQGVVNCPYQWQQWANTFSFLPDPAQAFSHALEQRAQLQIAGKCTSGEIDAASCANYTGMVSNWNNQSHETALSIINNMGGTSCLVGQDPNCY